jgi:hypothetical protein
MVNQVYVEKLVSLIKQGIITEANIKVQEYKDAVNTVINPA